MGLLKKATEHNTNTPTLRQQKFFEAKQELIQIKKSIEFYPAVFKELLSLCSIEKGALLLKEGEMFTLSSLTGYDVTTQNRLRMSYDEYKGFTKHKKIETLKKYFSIREFLTMKNIDIFPFINNGVVYGILLITEYKTEKIPVKNEIIGYIQDLEDLFGENPLQKLKKVEEQSNNLKESIASYLQTIKNKENRIILMKLNLNDLILKLRVNDNLSTESSIRNNSIKLLTSFSQNRGKVFQLYENNLLITLLDKQNKTNIMVIQQQINAAFRSIFSEKLESVDLSFESLIWKENSLDTILNHFIPDVTD